MDLSMSTVFVGLSGTTRRDVESWKKVVQAWTFTGMTYICIEYLDLSFKRGRCWGKNSEFKNSSEWQRLLSSLWHFLWSHMRQTGRQCDCSLQAAATPCLHSRSDLSEAQEFLTLDGLDQFRGRKSLKDLKFKVFSPHVEGRSRLKISTQYWWKFWVEVNMK